MCVCGGNKRKRKLKHSSDSGTEHTATYCICAVLTGLFFKIENVAGIGKTLQWIHMASALCSTSISTVYIPRVSGYIRHQPSTVQISQLSIPPESVVTYDIDPPRCQHLNCLYPQNQVQKNSHGPQKQGKAEKLSWTRGAKGM